MKKLLISAALMASLISPAIYATVQGVERQTEWKSCMKEATSTYTQARLKLISSYEKSREAVSQKTQSGTTVSGEKRENSLEKMYIEGRYQKDLKKIRDTYMRAKKACTR